MNKQQIPAYISIALVAYFLGGFMNPRVITQEVPKETVKTVVTAPADWKSLKDVDDQLVQNATKMSSLCSADLTAISHIGSENLNDITDTIGSNGIDLKIVTADAKDLISQRQDILSKLGY